MDETPHSLEDLQRELDQTRALYMASKRALESAKEQAEGSGSTEAEAALRNALTQHASTLVQYRQTLMAYTRRLQDHYGIDRG